MARIVIDNAPYEVREGKNLLEACLTLGLNLPYFCWHPALGSVGACRQCAIKSFKNEEDTKGKLVMACMEPVVDNQRISIDDPEAKEFRAHIIEWLMTNHPHDCAVCDEGGSCHLQDMTVMTGHAYRNFRFAKRTYRNQYLGPFINHEMNRCIQCYRCVRFYKDFAGGDDLDAFASKNKVYFGRSEEGVLENEFSGNLTEVCPTGVFTDKTLKKHYTRKWDLTSAPSVCQHCSLGCNILAGERYGSLRLVSSRYNGQVNGYFICDRGRFGYEFANAQDRITRPLVDGRESPPESAIKHVANLFAQGPVVGIGSPRASLESNYLLKRLVGDDRFYMGVADQESHLTDLALRILRNGNVRTPSMREVEMADAIFVLGEDLINTAPMLALAVRQSVRQQPMEKVHAQKIPVWNDAAARELIQEEKGPCFIATVHPTRLDSVATQTYRAAPADIARMGLAVADAVAGPAREKSDDNHALAKQIAQALLKAKRPVIISGTSSGSAQILHAAARLASEVHKKNSQVGIVLAGAECNSFGLAMLGGRPLKELFDTVGKSGTGTVLILENDLYRRAPRHMVDKLMQMGLQRIVLDHTRHATAEKAQCLIPAGTFAEADGTLVSNEGRAQRFFQVYEPGNGILESWRWLIKLAGELGRPEGVWTSFSDVVKAMAGEVKAFENVRELLPGKGDELNGQRIPREPHRFSGRTSMNANKAVSEPKPPEDPDSPMSYTMEGFVRVQSSLMIPFFWAPGWNSVQSVNKYQEEVGGSLRGGDPGMRLIEPAGTEWSETVDRIAPFSAKPGVFLAVPAHHIFGSEELSARSPAVKERIPKPYVLINEKDAEEVKLSEAESIILEIGGERFELQVITGKDLPRGVAGLPAGLPGVPFVQVPAEVKISKK